MKPQDAVLIYFNPNHDEVIFVLEPTVTKLWLFHIFTLANMMTWVPFLFLSWWWKFTWLCPFLHIEIYQDIQRRDELQGECLFSEQWVFGAVDAFLG